jgi:glutamyl-tRNA synthetase
VGERLELLPDIVPHSSFLFTEPLEYDEKALNKHVRKTAAQEILRDLHELLAEQDDFCAPNLEPLLARFAEERGHKPGKLYQPLRVALTGSGVSFGIFDILELLGKERTLARIRGVLEEPNR